MQYDTRALLLAVEVLLADPETLGNDALETDLYLLREQLTDAPAEPAPASGHRSSGSWEHAALGRPIPIGGGSHFPRASLGERSRGGSLQSCLHLLSRQGPAHSCGSALLSPPCTPAAAGSAIH